MQDMGRKKKEKKSVFLLGEVFELREPQDLHFLEYFLKLTAASSSCPDAGAPDTSFPGFLQPPNLVTDPLQELPPAPSPPGFNPLPQYPLFSLSTTVCTDRLHFQKT